MVKPTPLRWGFLGTARINQSLIEPIRSSANSILSAVASRSSEKAQEYAIRWGIPHFHSSYEELLADPEIDIIYNSLPSGLHAEWSIKAMQAGKHVLCEKPLTTSSQDADAVIEAANQNGRIITEAFMYRHHPQTILIKQMVDDGEIGELQILRGSFCYTNNRSSDPRFEPSLGGGSLWDVGCYPISYARHLVGTEPIEVYGHQVTGSTGVDLLYTGHMLYPRRVISQFECSFISPYKASFEITGTTGRITIPQPYKPGIKTQIYVERDGKSKTIKVIGKGLYLGEVEDIENSIMFGTPTRISLMESRGNIKTIELLIKAARISKPVSLLKK